MQNICDSLRDLRENFGNAYYPEVSKHVFFSRRDCFKITSYFEAEKIYEVMRGSGGSAGKILVLHTILILADKFLVT